MAQVTTETVTTHRDDGQDVKASPQREATIFQTVEYLVYFCFGALEVLLLLRFAFELMGANLASDFVRSIYNLSQGFIVPFIGIFNNGSAQGFGTTLVFEPATLVALLVYGFIASGIVMLIRVLSGKRQIVD
jgi:hypothetical protein